MDATGVGAAPVRRRRAAAPLLVVALLVAGVLPAVFLDRFYFRGDTQIAYVGWWYHLGESVRGGHLPLMEPLAWETGNHVAEGQWGLFSPLTILIGLLATVVPDLVVFVTVLKICLVVLCGTGTYLVVTSYGAREPFAMVAGIVVGLSSQSVFIDWPSWVNGQMGVALLPWAWWFTRRAMSGRSPAMALVLCYLTVSVGYVFSALYLAVVLLGCLVDAALSRSRRQLLTVLALGVFSGLVTTAVYLPGVLTAPVTVRASWAVVWRGWFTLSLRDLFVSVLPTPRRYYLLWLLPALFWLDPRRLRGAWRDLLGATVSTVVLTLWALGPSVVGPIRWPARVLPALMVTLVVLLAVAASRCLVTRVSATRLALSLAWVGAAAALVVARNDAQLKQTLAGAGLVAAALLLTAWSLTHRRPRTGLAVVLVSTLAMLTLQLAVGPAPAAADRNMPALAAQYADPIPSATGDVMVLGNPSNKVIRDPAIADELLVGASWLLNPKDVQNGYTTISFRAFRDRFCRTFNGGTCPEALDELLTTDPTTGRPWVDLLSVGTLVLFRPSFPELDPSTPPPGWRVSALTEYTAVWSRADRVPTAGGVVAVSPGSAVTEEGRSDREVRLRVDSVAPEGGTVTLSRLAWPGYSVDGGDVGAPLDDILVRVELPAGSAGSTVTVRWDPPGWAVERAALAVALLGGAAWALLASSGAISRGWRRRRPAGRTGPGRPDPLPDPPA